MAVYYAEVEYTTTLFVRVETDDEEEPNDEAIWDAVSDWQNHRDEHTRDQKILSIELAEQDSEEDNNELA
jgi:hypothetical protein